MAVRLISWNLNKRRAIDAQITALGERQPDFVALQEVKARHLEALRRHFAEIGLPYVLDSHTDPTISQRGYIVVASRWPITCQPRARRLPCPESTLTVRARTPHGDVELHAIHVPTVSNSLPFKDAFLEEVCTRLSHRSRRHRILCGDFNFPQRELTDGTLITFAEKIRADGTFFVRRGHARHAEIERFILNGLAEYDLHDVYRGVNGFIPQECSWYAHNRGRAFGFRLDHILASKSLHPQACSYLHHLREGGLSDHSAIEAVFEPEPR